MIKLCRIKKQAPLILAGIDPSLSNFGMSKFEFDDEGLYPIDSKLQITKPEADKKAKVRKNCDDLSRATLLYDALHEFIIDCDYVFMELPVGSQSARSMVSYAMCVGIAASIKKQPLILVMPNEVKLATGLNSTASKEQMIAWAVKKYPDIKWLRERNKPNGKLVKANEHIADSVAAVEAGLRTPEFSRILALYKKMGV